MKKLSKYLVLIVGFICLIPFVLVLGPILLAVGCVAEALDFLEDKFCG